MNAQELITQTFEHVRGMWRYRWRAAAVSWVIAIGGWFYVYTIPDIYVARAQVFVDTDSLLKPLMQGLTAQQNTMSEVQLVSTSVKTRPNLERVALETDLHLRATNAKEMEDLITGLQSNVAIYGGYDNVYNIQYYDTSRETARDVVIAVLDGFVESAIGAQGDDADVTERALAGEIKDHEDRLLLAEGTLAQFKKDNLGYMPGEAGDYYSRLQGALGAIGLTESRIDALTGRRDELQRQIEGEEPALGLISDSTAGGCSQSAYLSQLNSQLALLRVDYTDRHPRIVALGDQIALLQAQCADERATYLAAGFTPAGSADAGALDANPVFQNMRMQLSAAEVELAGLRTELANYQQMVETLRRDVDKIAIVETELQKLNRDYGVVTTRHQELLRRWEDLQAKKRLDPMTDRVQFKHIEPPFALADPVGPNRVVFNLMVLIVAIGAGGAAAFGFNQIRPVFYTSRSFQENIGLPVLGSVSLLLTPRAILKRRAAGLAWGASYLVLVIATGVVIVLSAPGSWLVT